jgi:hypothetical protein
MQRASVTHIQGYRGYSSQFKPCKINNLTTQHTYSKKAPRVATVHDMIKELGRVLPHPSAVFYTNASLDSPWLAWHYPF